MVPVEVGRYVGQVMIPWKMIKRVEAEADGVDAALAAAASGTVLSDLGRDNLVEVNEELREQEGWGVYF